MYAIPGNGKDYPVQPGKSLLICDKAIDHREANSNSFDLSNADFEWYDDSDKNPDIDNPQVTNLDKSIAIQKRHGVCTIKDFALMLLPGYKWIKILF